MGRIDLRWQGLALAAVVAALAACAGGERPGPPHAGHTGHAHRVEHAHHGFQGAEQWAKVFDDPARDAWQRPDAVLDRLELRDGMRVADVGAGTGYFAVRLARRLPGGRVYGVDVEPDMVRYLAERASREHLPNLESRLAAPDDPLLPEPVDLVLVVDVYHHLPDRAAYFARVARQLAPGGRVAIVDFKMGDRPVGPPDRMKIPADRIVAEMHAAGYRVALDDRELLPHQNLLIFAAPAP
jgi:SAM-dependent methyltransferase